MQEPEAPPAGADSEMMLTIARVIIDELKLEEATPETFDTELHLVDELGIDSMDLTTVVLVLQDIYGIRFDEDDFPKLTNVRKIAAYIRDLQAS